MHMLLGGEDYNPVYSAGTKKPAGKICVAGKKIGVP
jgi:hypothetical protein